jgi:D-3-phosphoglycerate dehydrogenase / 2-oxoglutarate reductase
VQLLPERSRRTETPFVSVEDTEPVRHRVLVREPIAQAGLELLKSKFDVVEDGTEDLASIIAGFDAIVIRSATILDAPLIERATRLKVIGRAGVGIDNVDVDAATRRGIVVANAPESTVISAAEHALALMLALARNVPQAHAALKDGRWERPRFAGIELAGKTLGVLGLGRIGREVARRSLALGMRVIAYDPFVALERFRELGVEAATLEEVYAAADVITLHLPLNDETRGVLAVDAFAAMRTGVRIVNAARGELVDETALADAIRSGKVAGAALDVFGEEPYSGPLLELDQVVVTPHLAASTAEAQDRAGLIIAEQVVSALEGGLVATAVNIPIVEQSDLEVLGPYVPLAATLGRLASSLVTGRPSRIVVSAHGPLSGYDTRLLTVAALNGVFQGRVDQAVNYVNAPLIAAERGIDVSEQRFAASQHYTNLVQVGIAANGEELEVSGTTVGPEHRLFLAGAFGFAIDIELAERMAFLDYDDVPGVIGRVGTMFGEADVNIANMAVSRTKEGGRALMAFSIDTSAPPDLIERVRSSGFGFVRFIDLAGFAQPSGGSG